MRPARGVYQQLKGRLVAALHSDRWALTEERLRQAINDIQRERGLGHAQ
jgi:hypothetical protein